MGWSEDALNCSRCPKEGCPLWWKTSWTNAAGEMKLEESCGLTQLPLYLTEVVKASNRPAAAIESARNEIAKGFGALGQIFIHERNLRIGKRNGDGD